MFGQGDRFGSPFCQSEQRSDPDSPKSCRVRTFRSFQSPIEIPFWSGRVNLGVGFAVVRFLVDDQTFRAGRNEWLVIVDLHRSNLERDGRHEGNQSSDNIQKITVGDKLRMFAGNQQNIAETLANEVSRFRFHFVRGESDSQDRIIPRKPAVLAVVDALAGKIKRRKQPHGSTEKPARDCLRLAGQLRQLRVLDRLEQSDELIYRSTPGSVG